MKSRSHHYLFAMRTLMVGMCVSCVALWSTAVLAQEDHDEHKIAHAESSDHGHEEHGDGSEHGHAHGDADHGEEHHGAEGEHGHDEGGHDEHGDEHHADGHGEAPAIWEDLSLWSIIAFAGFCLAIAKLGLWDSLQANMSSREKSENEAIESAESNLAEANSALSQYRGQLEAMDETLAEQLAEAQRDADHTQNEIVEIANREAQSMLNRAELEIERTRDQSLNSLFEHLSIKVTEAAQAKVKSDLQAADQDRLIDDTLNQLAAN